MLIVHVIETKSILMLLSKILSDSIRNKYYAVSYLHAVQLTIETTLLLSEMYHDIFTYQKKYNFIWRRLIIKSGRQIKHAYILYLLSLCIFS